MLARINGAIEARRAAGEALPPPPKTAIAGPEYFGLTHPAILPQLEALDADRICIDYWAGKQACAPAPMHASRILSTATCAIIISHTPHNATVRCTRMVFAMTLRPSA